MLVMRLKAALKRSPLAARMTRGAFWSVASSGINRALGLAVSIVVARIIGKTLFGELGVIQSTMSVFAMVAGFGTSLTATRHVAKYRDEDPARAGRIAALAGSVSMISAAIVAGVVVAIAPWLAARVLNAPHVAPLVRLGAALIFFEAWNGAKAGALAGLEAFQAIARVDLFAGLTGVACTAAGVWLGGIEGALLGMVAGAAAHSLGYSIALRQAAAEHQIPLASRRAFDEWRVLLGFSLPSLLAAASASLVNWLCRVVVVNEPDGYAQMGLFQAAAQWRTAILFLPATLGHAFLPVLSNMVGKRDEASYRKILRTSVTINATVAVVAACVVCVAAPLILRGYGRDFAGGQPVLVVLALASVLSATVGMVGQAIISAGEMWLGFALNGVWGGVVLGATWLLRREGAYGFAIANLIAYSVHLVTSFVAYRVTAQRLFGRPAA
jgi:O-antigen/teichoic acid export membrane protein